MRLDFGMEISFQLGGRAGFLHHVHKVSLQWQGMQAAQGLFAPATSRYCAGLMSTIE